MAIKWRDNIERIITFLGFCAAVVGIVLFMSHTVQFIHANLGEVFALLRKFS
ncbi:hypothetical protein GCM10007425_19850 [Lysinibacillus alkalisoli]|uniref:Uncharacterized protein n=1 Tax=Lysinibacillus alkalisoli TaxID=1911548 RepID=A0A917LHX6_9BACI|nr:hypothetical protein [Lysinibacillus alkalisoli]GGG25285.1 hypothetical protein GCM10007425_19850 [Lysinibacillus alkalisoli]